MPIPSSPSMPALVLLAALAISASGRAEPPPGVGREPEAGELRLVALPDSCATIGSPAGELHRQRGERQRQACVSDLWMAATEVSNGQYRRFRPDHDSGRHRQQSLNRDDQPVVAVSQRDARAYAAWLSERSGRRYRLPTDAEWEFAARAGRDDSRPWGEDPTLACREANLHDQRSTASDPTLDWPAHPCDDTFAVAAPVGSLSPNRWGLHDLLGNVWEWTCSAVLAPSGEASTDCAEPPPGGEPRVIARGGSWVSGPGEVRSAAQLPLHPDHRYRTVGFRLVLEGDPRR